MSNEARVGIFVIIILIIFVVLSMKIGEQRLFPAVRAAKDAVVIASGVSCREQIEHGTGRHVLHPVEFVAERLRKE